MTVVRVKLEYGSITRNILIPVELKDDPNVLGALLAGVINDLAGGDGNDDSWEIGRQFELGDEFRQPSS